MFYCLGDTNKQDKLSDAMPLGDKFYDFVKPPAFAGRIVTLPIQLERSVLDSKLEEFYDSYALSLPQRKVLERVKEFLCDLDPEAPVFLHRVS